MCRQEFCATQCKYIPICAVRGHELTPPFNRSDCRAKVAQLNTVLQQNSSPYKYVYIRICLNICCIGSARWWYRRGCNGIFGPIVVSSHKTVAMRMQIDSAGAEEEATACAGTDSLLTRAQARLKCYGSPWALMPPSMPVLSLSTLQTEWPSSAAQKLSTT